MFNINPERQEARQQRREAARQQFAQRQSTKQELKDYVNANKSSRITEFHGVHVFADRIIRFPNMFGGVLGVEPECRPIAGVTATAGSEWRRKNDRKGYVAIDGPGFQWQVAYDATVLGTNLAKKFCEKVSTAG